METNRETLRIVVVGHVDHGKSTVIGRLLYDTKSLPEGAIDRVKRISKEKGKPFEYAYLLDAFEEEQKQGITIDTTQLQFHTDKRDYVIIDAPGHKEFLKNMISGAANAEAALLIIDAHEGIQEQSKRHGYILSLMGIQKVYVLVNKMDLIDYSEEKFNQIKRDMNEFLNNLNVFPLKYIPVSAFFGENIVEKSAKMHWYKGEPIVKAIDQFERDKGLEDKPLRFPIQDVYKFDHRRIIAGRIESGTLKAGDEIFISPSNKVTRVKSIEYWPTLIQESADSECLDARRTENASEGVQREVRRGSARRSNNADGCYEPDDSVQAGMSVGITVEDEFFNQRGEFISHIADAPLAADTFKASLFWMGKKPLVKGKEYVLKLVTQEVECEVYSITKVIDATTLAEIENASEVKTNDVAEVIIKTKKKISFDEFKNNQNTGRFVLVDGYDVSGGGIVSGLVKGVQTVSKFAKNDQETVISLFDEYYFILSEGTIRKIEGRHITFELGDILPITGQTYEYPEAFDVLDTQTQTVAQIRKAKLHDIQPLDAYTYSGIPLLDTKGASFRVISKEDFIKLKSELAALNHTNHTNLAAFANRWLEFGGFRIIRYLDAVNPVEYQI